MTTERRPQVVASAARIDGSGFWSTLRAVTLPGLRQEIGVCITVTVIAALASFDIVYIATGGGPGQTTTVPGLEVYRLAFAHRELEQLTLDRETYHFKEAIALKYAEILYYGLWFSPLREALDAFVAQTQETVTGTVMLQLYKGNIIVSARTSPYSLYHSDMATFESDDLYDHKDAQGFINLFGLPLKIRGLLSQEWKQPVKEGEIG